MNAAEVEVGGNYVQWERSSHGRPEERMMKKNREQMAVKDSKKGTGNHIYIFVAVLSLREPIGPHLNVLHMFSVMLSPLLFLLSSG